MGDTYQVAHHALRLAGCIGGSGRYSGLPSWHSTGPSLLLNPSCWGYCGSLARYATTSAATTTATTATVGADDLIETLVELGRHL